MFLMIRKNINKEEKEMDKVKEATGLVDTVFDDPAEFKKANAIREADGMVDTILDDCGKEHGVEEVENKIENAPIEDPEEEVERVKDDIAGDESAMESAVNVIDNMLKLNETTAYQKFFQAKLKAMGVNSPAELPADKKKAFFNAVDKGWKAKKESD